jgi:hypothetical protein
MKKYWITIISVIIFFPLSILIITLLETYKPLAEKLVEKSKLAYETKMLDVLSLKANISSNELDKYLSISLSNYALEQHDTLLYKIHMSEKEHYELANKLCNKKLNKCLKEQNSLLKNDPILIERGILITDDTYDIDLKFEYFEKNKKRNLTTKTGVDAFVREYLKTENIVN